MRWYWIDRFVEFESGRSAKAIKNVTLSEDHLHDHFYCYPMMPKSLIIEGIAQTGGLLVFQQGNYEEKVVLAKIPKIEFYFDAVPGDTLEYSVVADHFSEYGAMITATSHCNGKLQAEGRMAFAHLADSSGQADLFNEGELTKMMRILRVFEVGRDADGNPLPDPALAGK